MPANSRKHNGQVPSLSYLPFLPSSSFSQVQQLLLYHCLLHPLIRSNCKVHLTNTFIYQFFPTPSCRPSASRMLGASWSAYQFGFALNWLASNTGSSRYHLPLNCCLSLSQPLRDSHHQTWELVDAAGPYISAEQGSKSII